MEDGISPTGSIIAVVGGYIPTYVFGLSFFDKEHGFGYQIEKKCI